MTIVKPQPANTSNRNGDDPRRHHQDPKQRPAGDSRVQKRGANKPKDDFQTYRQKHPKKCPGDDLMEFFLFQQLLVVFQSDIILTAQAGIGQG